MGHWSLCSLEHSTQNQPTCLKTTGYSYQFKDQHRRKPPVLNSSFLPNKLVKLIYLAQVYPAEPVIHLNIAKTKVVYYLLFKGFLTANRGRSLVCRCLRSSEPGNRGDSLASDSGDLRPNLAEMWRLNRRWIGYTCHRGCWPWNEH